MHNPRVRILFVNQKNFALSRHRLFRTRDLACLFFLLFFVHEFFAKSHRLVHKIQISGREKYCEVSATDIQSQQMQKTTSQSRKSGKTIMIFLPASSQKIAVENGLTHGRDENKRKHAFRVRSGVSTHLTTESHSNFICFLISA